MSLYNMVFGKNPHAEFILATLNLTTNDVGRFRDAFVTEGQIAIYTRNGGGNREDYQHVFDALAGHPLYLRNADDEFDCTYCTYWFSLPEEWKVELREIESGTFDPSARWLEKIDEIKAGKISAPMLQLVEEIRQKLASGEGGTIHV